MSIETTEQQLIHATTSLNETYGKQQVESFIAKILGNNKAAITQGKLELLIGSDDVCVLLARVTALDKIHAILNMTEDQLRAVLKRYGRTVLDEEFVEGDPMTFLIRVLYIQALKDWGGQSADNDYQLFRQFVDDPTFQEWSAICGEDGKFSDDFRQQVPYGDLFDHHSRSLEAANRVWPELDMEMVGIRRITPDSGKLQMQVLVEHNQVVQSFKADVDGMTVPRGEYDLPPSYSIALLLRDLGKKFYRIGAGTRDKIFLNMRDPRYRRDLDILLE